MAGALIGCAMAFTACSDDLSHNPTLQTPETFTLNTPAYSTSNIDLETTDSMRLTWSQPDYGFPAAAQYEVQVSLNDDWSVSTEQAAADESGKTKPTYATVSDPTGVCSTSVIGSTLAKGIQTIGGWGEDDIPAKKDVKVRVMSVYAKDTIYSNVINLTVVPYFVKDVVPMGWYLIGSCIGDGSWGGEIGPNMIPMYAIAGENYDKKSGEGKFSWTGYLTTEGFKLKKEADKWDDQIGQKKGDDGTLEYDADGNPVLQKNEGGSGNITVKEDGYYTITLDTKALKKIKDKDVISKDIMTITKLDKAPSVFEQIYCTGDFDSWKVSGKMTPVHTKTGLKNHDWYFVLDASDGDTTAKFTTAGWSTNWGSESFPYGTGTNGGGNIAVAKGKYKVIFNDITGQYVFIAQ